MEVRMEHRTNAPKLFAAAFSEWLLVLPATLLLGGAALRQLQPAQNEHARTISTILAWIGPHISHADAALLFIGLPAIGIMAGVAVLLWVWRGNETPRQDVAAVIATVRRHLAIAILGTGTLLACAILAAVLVHIIMD